MTFKKFTGQQSRDEFFTGDPAYSNKKKTGAASRRATKILKKKDAASLTKVRGISISKSALSKRQAALKTKAKRTKAPKQKKVKVVEAPF